MLLALKCLSQGIQEPFDVTIQERTALAKSIRLAVNWLMPQAQSHLRNNSSLAVSVQIAREEIKFLFPAGAMQVGHRMHGKERTVHHKHCEMVWQLVQCHARISGPDPMVKADEIKSALKKLSQHEPSSDQGARKRQKGPLYPFHEQASHAGQRPGDGNSTEMVMANLTISKDDRQRYLNRYDHLAGVAPRDGPTQCPINILAKHINTLVGTEWVDDTTIDGYLCLVCHAGNGHFQLKNDDDAVRVGSPKWNAWSEHFFRGLGTHALFPPSMYPDAQVEDVKHHLFPLHSTNHWVLFHVYSKQANWHADFFSSLPNYDFEVKARWPYIVEHMLLLSKGRLDLSSVKVQIPKQQPRQSNSSDCGVLALCVARWIMEGWVLETIQPQNCQLYRQRMIVELEKWHLG
ncbi:MAG: hypothetical protein L6R35_006766 [Caloplaca aegaea]|nr:MAG: hypothetical protein L6R35_006766 [Caloplaca aegaea]